MIIINEQFTPQTHFFYFKLSISKNSFSIINYTLSIMNYLDPASQPVVDRGQILPHQHPEIIDITEIVLYGVDSTKKPEYHEKLISIAVK